MLVSKSEALDRHEFTRQLAVLEERMNTSYERLRAELAARETRMLLLIAGMFGLAVAIFGYGLVFPVFLIRPSC